MTRPDHGGQCLSAGIWSPQFVSHCSIDPGTDPTDSLSASLAAKAKRRPPITELTYVQRHRFDKGQLTAVDHRYMRTEHCRRLSRQDVQTSSLVDYLRNREGLSLSHGEMEIEAQTSSINEGRLFGTKAGGPVLVRRVLFFSKKQPILDGESIYRSDTVVVQAVSVR